MAFAELRHSPFSVLSAISLLLLISTQCLIPIARGELFTALIDLTRALDAERQLAGDLLKYIEDEQKRLLEVQQLASQLTAHASRVLEEGRKLQENKTRVAAGGSGGGAANEEKAAGTEKLAERYLSNPVNAYLLIKRYAHDWKVDLTRLVSPALFETKKLDRVLSPAESRLVERVALFRNDMPSEEDLKGAVAALLRLQDTYRLSTKKIADGHIHPNTQSPPLTAGECYFLGTHSYDNDDLYHTRLWMQEALERLDSETSLPSGPTVKRAYVLDYLSFASYKQGQLLNALTLTNEWLTLEPEHERALSNRKYFEKEMAKEKANKTRLGDDAEADSDEAALNNRPSSVGRGEEFMTYEALCRDEEVIPDHNAHLLYCDYYKPHPHYFIGPVKQEVVFYKPRIVVWYDILYNEENEELRHLATPKLNRATVQNSITGQLEYANYRISKSSWLPYSYSDITERVNDRIQALTNIDISTAEDLQVVNYGIGGQYEPHYDFARRREKNAFEKRTGNRIATLLFYLSNVDAGGATVFTRIGARLFPRRNSAAFWWNLYPSGDGDLMTRHAACPVLAGSKWVMNKWFHERGQEFRRPCKMTKNAA